jgi:hypothetical protein
MINILIILFIIILFFIINKENFTIDFYDSFEINQDNKLVNDDNIENQFNCYLYGCNSSRNDMIEWIGSDNNNNQIFTNNSDYFMFNNGFLNKIDNINKDKIIKNNDIISIPFTNKDDKLKLKLDLKYQDYNFVGYLINNFYNIKYLLYGKIIDNTLYEYIVIKIIDNDYKVLHKLPLRSKIENIETIWIDYGPIMLGPLVFTTK